MATNVMVSLVGYIQGEILAPRLCQNHLSPGSTQLFNVTQEKTGEPGKQSRCDVLGVRVMEG